MAQGTKALCSVQMQSPSAFCSSSAPLTTLKTVYCEGNYRKVWRKREEKLELKEKRSLTTRTRRCRLGEKSGQGKDPGRDVGGAATSKRSKYKKIEAKRGRGGKKKKERKRKMRC